MAQPQPKLGILDIMPYKGGEAKNDDATRLVRLASNENPYGCSPKAIEAYQKASAELMRYPDGGAEDLRAAIATQYDLDAAQIACGAGSDELISLLVRSYVGVGDNLVYSQHGFLMYPIAAKTVGAQALAAPEQDLRTDVKAILETVTDMTRMVFIANPNNPTGSYITGEELAYLRKELREDIILVVDAAYAEYVERPDYTAGLELISDYSNVVMLRTFSKIYGLAALRLGWAYASPEMIDVLNRVRGPFNTNLPAQHAGIAAVQDQSFIDMARKMNNHQVPLLSDALEKMGYYTYPSVGNFVLTKFGERAEEIRLKLKDQGIFVRQMGAYQLPDCLRITVGTEEENQILIDALSKL